MYFQEIISLIEPLIYGVLESDSVVILAEQMLHSLMLVVAYRRHGLSVESKILP